MSYSGLGEAYFLIVDRNGNLAGAGGTSGSQSDLVFSTPAAGSTVNYFNTQAAQQAFMNKLIKPTVEATWPTPTPTPTNTPPPASHSISPIIWLVAGAAGLYLLFGRK